MTDKERLNTILRLRLFYSTEKELGNKVGLSLKGNHFSRQKPFVCEAFFCKFAEECKQYTRNKVNLEWLICQYESTSKFFKKHIKATIHEANKRFIPCLLNYIYMRETPNNGAQDKKDIKLCERYDDYNKENKMNVGILILMTYGLIPTFNNKSSQDVSNIIKDFQKAHDILSKIAQLHQASSSTKYKEMLCLKEMRKLIEQEQDGGNYINRLLLIHITNDVLNRIFALKKPAILRQYSKEAAPMDFELPRLWLCEDDADNIVWEFAKPGNVDAYHLFRNEIDYKEKKIRFTRYQLFFEDTNCKNFCYTVIMRPSFNWHNMLRKEQPEDSLSFDYTYIEYDDDKHTAKQLTFTEESPVSEKPMTLKAIKKQETLNYYTRFLDHKGSRSDFEDEDNEPQYAIAIYIMEVAISNTAILFKSDDGIYKLEKFDKEGNETIPGIRSLNHTDNFIRAELDNYHKKTFLCLDSINQNLDLDDLLEKPYFHRIQQASEIF